VRIRVERTTSREKGSHIHRSSLLMAAKPHLLKKALTPMGKAIIGVQAKKCLELSN